MRAAASEGPVSMYARFCQRRLLGSSIRYMPSIEEISAYDQRPPILASVFLVDGTLVCEDLPVTPDTSVETVSNTFIYN